MRQVLAEELGDVLGVGREAELLAGAAPELRAQEIRRLDGAGSHGLAAHIAHSITTIKNTVHA